MFRLFPANSVWQRISGHSAGNYSDPNTNGQNSGISEHYYRSEHRPIDGGVMADDGEQQQPGKRPRRVILEHGKLTYDGKTFQRLHNVFISEFSNLVRNKIQGFKLFLFRIRKHQLETFASARNPNL
jgi:hypothetical protein